MKNNKENIDIKMLRRYLEGNGSVEDKNIIKGWFANIDSEQELYEKSLQFWDGISLNPDVKGYTGAHILDRIHHKLRIEEGVLLGKTNSKVRFINYLTRIAAILFIPLLVASLLFFIRNNFPKNVVSYSEIHAPIGARINFSLPDGSNGWLNGGSSLRFPAQFGSKIRDVKLTGEAYFNVISNHNKPFIVSTKDIDVKVFGTSFNVMAYTDEQITEVTLENGKVEVFKKTDNLVESIGILKPNESCIYDSKSGSGRILFVNCAEKLSWLNGTLTFRYESFEELIRKINRWYNVNIVIMDEALKSYTYYGTFKDETLDEVLSLLQHTAPIRYRKYARESNPDGTFEKRKIEIYYRR